MALNSGSWNWYGVQLPDFGVTEKLSNLLGAPRTQQGGSNIFGASSYKAAAPTSTANKTSYAAPSGLLPSSQYNPTSGSGQVLGTNTLSGYSAPSGNNDPYNMLSSAAQNNTDAQLQEANSAYDYNRSQLENNLSSLGNQRQNSLNELQTALSGVQKEVGNQKTAAEQAKEKNIQQAGETAQNTQRSNRNVLRALGILNSTAAGEMLSKPINEFDKQRADFVQSYQTRVNQLDDFMMQKTSEHYNAVKGLENQYADLVKNIQTDLRFNERQRADAVKAATAALSQRIGEIQMAQQTYKNQVDSLKQNFATEMAKVQGYSNPTFDNSSFASTAINPGQSQTSSTASIYDDPTKKRLSALYQ